MHYFFAVALTVAAPEGHWIAARYADALASTRSPSRAEKIEAPVAVTIKGNRAEVTDFHECSWRIIKLRSLATDTVRSSPFMPHSGRRRM